jgi:hypothetical protein
MIRPDKIIQILQNTIFVTPAREMLALQKFLNLEGDDVLGEYADQLYQISAGHPRTLLHILKKRCKEICSLNVCQSVRPTFVTANEKVISGQAAKFIQETALKFSKATSILLKSCRETKTDLKLADATDGVTFEHLLPALRIGYENLSSSQIRLCIPDRVRMLLDALVSPLSTI